MKTTISGLISEFSIFRISYVGHADISLIFKSIFWTRKTLIEQFGSGVSDSKILGSSQAMLLRCPMLSNAKPQTESEKLVFE